MAAELCESGAELARLNSQHAALVAEAKKGPDFPTAQDIDQARTEREKNAETRSSAKLVPVRVAAALVFTRMTAAACLMAMINIG